MRQSRSDFLRPAREDKAQTHGNTSREKGQEEGWGVEWGKAWEEEAGVGKTRNRPIALRL